MTKRWRGNVRLLRHRFFAPFSLKKPTIGPGKRDKTVIEATEISGC
jgi:hypothetical protein